MATQDNDFLLKALGNGIGYPFCVFDTQEFVVICNDAFERLIGVRGMDGLPLMKIFEATEFAPIVPGIRMGLTGIAPEPATVVIEGFPVHQYQAVVKPIHRAGLPLYAVITLADVTEKMESLAFALKARQFYNRVFDEMPQAYLMLDEDFVALRTNHAAAEMFGYSQHDLLGISLGTLLTSTGKASLVRHLEDFKNESQTTLRLGAENDILGVRRDSSVFPIRISLVRSDLSQLRTYSMIALDLSQDREHERRSIEQEKKQQGAMRNEALGKLAGKFAHDMNNILAVIGGNAEILNFSPREEDKESISEINEAVNRAASLTTRILAYTARQQLETRPLDLNTFISERVTQWRDALGPSIALRTDVGESSTVANADERMLLQIVFSLLANSREALHSVGKVIIGVRRSRLDEAFFKAHGVEGVAGDFSELYICDNGPGIPADKLQMIFEPYFSTKDPNKSSGLGLAIVFGIVKQHNGFIFCESFPGKETVMRVLFPLTEGEVAPLTENEILPKIHPPDYTVLVVDDEEPILRILETTLTQSGFKVLTATNGRAAIEVVEKYDGEISLLISDVMMPEVSGIELVQHLLLTFPQLPVIFVTGYSHQVIDKHPVLRHFRVVNKPFLPGEIVSLAMREIALRVPSGSESDDALPE